MTEHKIGLMMGENKAFIERIAWYTVGIVNLLVDVDYQWRIAVQRDCQHQEFEHA